MSHNIGHNVTNAVSHGCPDQTRPDQIVFPLVLGSSNTNCMHRLGLHQGQSAPIAAPSTPSLASMHALLSAGGSA